MVCVSKYLKRIGNYGLFSNDRPLWFGLLIIVSYTNYGMRLLEKIKLGIRFLKVWGKPPQHTHTFSPEKLASLMEDAGFAIEKSKLIGNRTKALYLIGKKN